MYVEVRQGRASVRDCDDCGSLDVRVTPADRPLLDAILRDSGLGRWDGGAEADLDVAGLQAEAAVGEVGVDWTKRWTAMIAYAATKGWLSNDGASMRAHLQQTR